MKQTQKKRQPRSSFLKILFIYLFIYLFIEAREGKREGKEGERKERNIDWLHPAHLQPGTQPATQACALTGNQTSNLLIHGPMPNPLSPSARAKADHLNKSRRKPHLPGYRSGTDGDKETASHNHPAPPSIWRGGGPSSINFCHAFNSFFFFSKLLQGPVMILEEFAVQ